MRSLLLLKIGAGLMAAAWAAKLARAAWGLPRIPNLLLPAFDLAPSTNAAVTVIVPARNEAAAIDACLQSLLAQDLPQLHIIAVDDRSTDATGPIMDRLAAAHPARLRVQHIQHLPPGWLGKTHAMAIAAAGATTPFLLFTDADTLWQPDTLRRSLTLMEQRHADHLVTMPTTTVKRADEDVLLGLLQILGLWAIPLWRVREPSSPCALGVGAFNLVRRQAYLAVGGFAALRLAVVEDLALGRRLKRSGFRTEVAFGRDMVRLHWAYGAHGIVRVMTKNAFAAVEYRPLLALLACVGLAAFFIAPFAGLFYAPVRLPSTAIVLANLLLYRLMRPYSGLRVTSALLSPLAATVLIYALLRSTLLTLRQNGIYWRDTFYPLAELKAASRNLPLPSTRSIAPLG